MPKATHWLESSHVWSENSVYHNLLGRGAERVKVNMINAKAVIVNWILNKSLITEWNFKWMTLQVIWNKYPKKLPISTGTEKKRRMLTLKQPISGRFCYLRGNLKQFIYTLRLNTASGITRSDKFTYEFHCAYVHKAEWVSVYFSMCFFPVVVCLFLSFSNIAVLNKTIQHYGR